MFETINNFIWSLSMETNECRWQGKINKECDNVEYDRIYYYQLNRYIAGVLVGV